MSIELKHAVLGTVIMLVIINVILLCIWGLDNYTGLCCTDPIILVITFPILYFFAKTRHETEINKIRNIINNNQVPDDEKKIEIQSEMIRINTSLYNSRSRYITFLLYFFQIGGILLLIKGIWQLISEKSVNYSIILLGVILIISYFDIKRRTKT
jgi:hypothetical protein